jgi:hypothetical protein
VRVLHQIGAGGVGPVFRGEDPETRRPVVIKVLRVGLPPERVTIAASTLAAVRERLAPHPALCAMLDTGVQEAEPFVVSAFVDGDSLDVALREFGPANISDALPRLRQLADALDSAAAVGVVHGGLHLRDIVVSPEHTVLTGIGIASVLERVGVRPPVRRPYTAPEIAAGHGVSPAGDQFALAAIAHEWLSGRRIAGAGGEGFHLPGSTPAGTEAVAAVFCRALDEQPDGRYPTATAFVDALADVSDALAPRTRVARRRAAAAESPRLAFDMGDDAGAAVQAPVADDGPPVAKRPPAAAAAPEPPPAPPRSPIGAAVPAMTMAPAPDDDEDVVDDDQDVADEAEDRDDLVEDDDVEAGALDDEDDDEAAAADADHLAIDTGLGVDEVHVRRHDDHSADDDAIAAFEAGRDDAGPMDAPLPIDPPGPRFDPVAAFDPAAAFEPPLADEPVTVRSEPRARFERLPEIDDAPDPSPSPDVYAPTFGRDDASAGDAPRPLPWIVGLVALTAVIVVGGYLLVRWGTPSGDTPSPSAGSPATPPAAATSTAVPGTPAASAASGAATSAPKTAAPPAPEPKTTPPPAAAPPAKTEAPATPAAKNVAPPAAASAPPAPRTAARPAAPPAKSGRLLVRSTPAGAEVFVNGTRRGVTPLALRELALGGYDVRINRAGYTAAEQRVTLDAGRTSRTVDVTLRRSGAAATAPAAAAAAPAAASAPPAAASGSLLVDSRPPGARVTVDGRDVGLTPVTVGTLAPGDHTVRIELAGYQPIATTARVEPGVRARVAVSLTIERPEDR